MSDKINTTLLLILTFFYHSFRFSFYIPKSNKVYKNVFLDGSERGAIYVNYLESTNRGLNWDNYGNVAESRSGFPYIDGLSDGTAKVTMQTTAGGLTTERSQEFVDLGPGFGSFNRFDQELVNGN